MPSAPPTSDETDRLRVLRELHLLDHGPQERFDTVIRLATRQLKVPMAWLGLIDESRVWLAAQTGLNAHELPRDGGPCEHASGKPDLIEVVDCQADGSQGGSPWFTDAAVRFCASVALYVQGHWIGVLGIADHAPRRLNDDERMQLSDLARMAEALLQAQHRERSLRQQAARLRAASLSSSDWLWETNEKGQVTWVSDSIQVHTGRPPDADIGLTMQEINRRCDSDFTNSWDNFLERRSARKPFKELITERVTPQGVIVTSISGIPVFDRTGQFRGYRGATSNITERLQARNAARKAEQLLKDALESLTAGVMITDSDGRVVRSNAVFRNGFRDMPMLDSWPDTVRAMAAAGHYPDAVGREDDFVQWRLGLTSNRGEPHEMRWRDGWVIVSARRLADGNVVHMSVDISAGKRAELALAEQQQQLRDSQAQLSAVLEAVPDLWFVIDAQGRYLECSDPSHPMLAHSWASVKGQPFAMSVPQAVVDLALPAIEAVLRTGQLQRIEYGLTTLDGMHRAFEARLSPMPGDRVLYVMRDLTEQQHAAEKLRVSEELYRSVAATISDGLLVVASSRAIIAVNPAGCAILGADEATLVRSAANWPFELLDEDGHPLVGKRDPIRRVLADRQPLVGLVSELRRPDGMTRWLELNLHPLQARAGHNFSMVMTFRDVTQQRAAEQALLLAEERWNFALEGSGNGVWDWDIPSDTVYYSPRWKQMIGIADDGIGNAFSEWTSRVHPDDVEAVTRELRRHLRGEAAVYQSEHRLRHHDGHELWVMDRGKVVERDAQGQPVRLVGTRTDITLDRQAEQVMRDKQAAELASHAKSEFLSRMSHEMRTPLNAVIGFSQLLRLDPDHIDPEKLKTYADHVLDAGHHLLALINDVLDLQKVEEGALSLDMQSVLLDAAVQRAIELLSPMANERGVVFDNGMGAGLWVRADSQRLRQVLLNILSNAIKYNRPNGTVRLWTEPAARGRLTLHIEDNGPGMNAEQMSRLFQPFERLGRETSSTEGTGLGLIIARSLTQAIGGKLEVRSQPGRGTQVRIQLQCDVLPESTKTTTAAPKVDALVQAMARAPLRMLYVEDNRINAILFEEALRLHAGNIELRIAEDGEEALELAAAWRPEVLVLDAHLPGMSGFDVLLALRTLPGLATAPAYMCSADAMPDDVQRAYEAGFIGYWTKPVDISKVLAEIDHLVTQRPRDSQH
jgi:PAS domain S-box-containing protein